jgi:hypothetical protein
LEIVSIHRGQARAACALRQLRRRLKLRLKSLIAASEEKHRASLHPDSMDLPSFTRTDANIGSAFVRMEDGALKARFSLLSDNAASLKRVARKFPVWNRSFRQCCQYESSLQEYALCSARESAKNCAMHS